MLVKNDFKCPWCERNLYQYQPVIPIVGQCVQCRKQLRLVGDRYLTWPAWLQLKARISEPSSDQHLLKAIEVM